MKYNKDVKLTKICDEIEKNIAEGWSFYCSCGRAGVGNPAQDCPALLEFERFKEIRAKCRKKSTASMMQVKSLTGVSNVRECVACGRSIYNNSEKCYQCRKRECQCCGKLHSSTDLTRRYCAYCSQLSVGKRRLIKEGRR